MDDRHEHVIIYTRFDEREPLSFVISVQMYYENTSAVARQLARARQELKQYFPEKTFEIQPARMMLRKDRENILILGEAYVATYVVFEI